MPRIKQSKLRIAMDMLNYIWSNPSNEGQKLYRTFLAITWQLYKRTIALPVVVTLDNGLIYIADPRVGNSVGVIYTKLYEPEYVMFLREHLIAGNAMVDVGAQTGLFTILLAHILPHGVCFEPSPDSFKILARSLRLNDLDRFACINSAVSDIDGTAGFHITAPFGSLNKLDPSSAFRVPVVSLDAFVADKPLPAPLGLLKIDVEGAEVEVLRGARDLLRNAPSAMAIIENSGAVRIEAVLDEIGWRCFAIDRERNIHISAEAKGTAYNLLACGPSHPLWKRVGRPAPTAAAMPIET